MTTDVNKQIIFKLDSCKYFSIALDESSDITDSVILCIFVHFINNNFGGIEEFLNFRLLISTRGEDILKN